MAMKLLAVIVNYKTARMTADAIAALVPELRAIPASRAIVVDNDSGDGSYEELLATVHARGWSELVEVVRSDRNGGFGYGNNYGIRPALASEDPPDYVYILNSDAFPEPGSVRRLIAFLEAHPGAGIAGSYIHGPDGTPHETAFRFPTWISEFEAPLGIGWFSDRLRRWVVAMPVPKQGQQVDWLAGASMMIRRPVLDAIGLFDEAFFLYFEETDLCRRARLAGWPTFYVPESSVAHIGSASTGMKDLKKRTPTYYFDSRSHYFRKNHGAPYLWLANVAWVMGFCIGHVRRRLMNRPDRVHRSRVFLDFLSYHFVPGAWRLNK
jgi:N-acetylglucosaminyl-diphospho-decaprenol L-rhamnosyltransferase